MSTRADLERLTVPELKRSVTALGTVSGVARLRKEELINELLKSQEPTQHYAGVRVEYPPEIYAPREPVQHYAGVRVEYPPEIYEAPPRRPTMVLPAPPPEKRPTMILPAPPVSEAYMLPPPPPSLRKPVTTPIAGSPMDLYRKIKMVVFDFDCTLTNRHTSRASLDNIKALFNDEDLINMLIAHLVANDRIVAIASYGIKDVILAVMQDIFGTGRHNPFTEENVITPLDVSRQFGIQWLEFSEPPRGSGYNKNTMLKMLADRYNLKPDEIVLIDDSRTNVENARAGGYFGIFIPSCGGLTQSAYKQLREIVEGTSYKQLNINFPELWGEFLMENISK